MVLKIFNLYDKVYKNCKISTCGSSVDLHTLPPTQAVIYLENNGFELIEEFGIDTVRWTICTLPAQNRYISLGKSTVENSRKFITKLKNAINVIMLLKESFFQRWKQILVPDRISRQVISVK